MGKMPVMGQFTRQIQQKFCLDRQNLAWNTENVSHFVCYRSFDGCPSFEIPTLGIRLDLQLSHYCDHWEENELLQEYWVFLFNVVRFSTFLLNLHTQ